MSGHHSDLAGAWFVAGYRGGHGFMLAKLPPAAPNLPPRWSAPLFLSLSVAELGILMGVERAETFMVAMTDKTVRRLMHGSHTLLGMDQSMVAFAPQIENKSDVIATSNLDADIVSITHASGFMVDFSLAGGSVSVDNSKNRKLYGSETTSEAILGGTVLPPPELEALYMKLNTMVESGKSPTPPSRVSASLERMTAGFDPDRRIPVMPTTVET
ncbi:hypothetical protein N2152v2_001520 [Parachlorella kessleri]